MAVKIAKLLPDLPPSTGAVIVREVTPSRTDVSFISKGGPMLVYSAEMTGADELDQAVLWAVNWASRRSIDTVFVERSARG